MNRKLTFVCVMLLSAACSKKEPVTISYQPLPTTKLGHLVTVEDQDVTALMEKYDGHIKPVSAAHNIYEVFDATQQNILADFPKADITKNQMIQVLPTPDIKVFEELADDLTVNVAGQSQSCVRDAEAPEVKIELLNVNELKGKDGVFERGQVIRLSGRQSKGHASHPSDLKFNWYVVLPNAAKAEGPLSSEAEFDFKLDDLGFYQVGLVVQDSRNVCNVGVARFGVTSNPKFVKTQNSLKNIGDIGVDFSHLKQIHADRAWNVSQGEGQVIAILDTGVNYNHPYLNENIFVNPNETANGIDDDGNGLIDDIYGYDFAQSDAFPYDDNGHGSHVAGLAAAQVFGVAPKAKILPVKVVGVSGAANLGVALSAIYYAVDMGATVINASFGGQLRPGQAATVLEPVKKLFDYAAQKNVIIVTAAGNGTLDSEGKTVPLDIDTNPLLPASIDVINNITVAAVDGDGALTPYSNFGIRSVKVAAPGGCCGKSIFSAKQENLKGELFWGADGTSMAAPIVSGAVALMKATGGPKFSIENVAAILQETGPVLQGLQGKVKSGRVIDIEEALTKVRAKSR